MPGNKKITSRKQYFHPVTSLVRMVVWGSYERKNAQERYLAFGWDVHYHGCDCFCPQHLLPYSLGGFSACGLFPPPFWIICLLKLWRRSHIALLRWVFLVLEDVSTYVGSLAFCHLCREQICTSKVLDAGQLSKAWMSQIWYQEMP